MALTAKSLFLYGFEITKNNSSLDFRSTLLGAERFATLRVGFYSLTDLLLEVKRALEAADPAHIYTATANRTLVGGTQNRVTILTNGTYLDILFGTGTRVASSVGPLLGYPATNQTGATTYTGTTTAGTALITEKEVFNYIGPELSRSIFGAVNVSASGLKEAVVWNIQKFFEFNVKHEPEAKAKTEWTNFLTWAIQQKPLEFTPMITSPSTFMNCTLEKTSADGKGMAFKLTEMLPDFPFYYQTGLMTFRVKE